MIQLRAGWTHLSFDLLSTASRFVYNFDLDSIHGSISLPTKKRSTVHTGKNRNTKVAPKTPRTVTILVNGMIRLYLTSSLFVSRSKFPVTGCFTKTFLAYQNFAIHTPAKQAHIFILLLRAASMLGGIEGKSSCLAKRTIYNYKRYVEISMTDKLIEYAVPKRLILA